MSKDTKETDQTKLDELRGHSHSAVHSKAKKLTLEEKKLKVLRARKLQDSGPLMIPEDQKEDGFVYRFVTDDAKASNRDKYERIGYEVVHDTDLQVGDQSLSNPSRSGSAVEVTRGTRSVLMRIEKEIYDAAQEEEHKKVLETERMLDATKTEEGITLTPKGLKKQLDTSTE